MGRHRGGFGDGGRGSGGSSSSEMLSGPALGASPAGALRAPPTGLSHHLGGSNKLHSSFTARSLVSSLIRVFTRCAIGLQSVRGVLFVSRSAREGRDFSRLTGVCCLDPTSFLYRTRVQREAGVRLSIHTSHFPRRHWQWSSPLCWSSCSARQGGNQHGVVPLGNSWGPGGAI
jgi:hypothetical protein